MAVAPSPNEIYKRAVDEGRRRLDMPAIEQITTAFIAGVTIVFGIWQGGHVGYGDLATNVGLATLGNVAGGLFLITFTHAAQVRSERRGSHPNGERR